MTHEIKRILYIDDDEDISLILKFSLQDFQDVEVRSASTGEEGFKVAMEFNPDIILLDVMMPGMDGIATLKAMKLLPSLRNIPVVFMTAKAQKEEVDSYFKLGIADVIVKPFDPLTLADQVKKIWEKHETA